jgi:Pyridoxamine 5'-phosphate oxidase
MGKIFAGLDDRLRQFIVAQPVFFVATAPGCTGQPDNGHVNVSPKGYRDTFAVLGPTTVAYLDLTGSGAETIAHVRQNGRITIMFCSFTETPKILRLYGSGRVVLPGDPDWEQLASHFPSTQRGAAEPNRHSSSGAGANGHSPSGAETDGFPHAGAEAARRRAIIVAELDRIADSCGYAVPVMELREERDLLTRWAERKTPAQLAAYRAEKNEVSIDGLPALG